MQMSSHAWDGQPIVLVLTPTGNGGRVVLHSSKLHKKLWTKYYQSSQQLPNSQRYDFNELPGCETEKIMHERTELLLLNSKHT